MENKYPNLLSPALVNGVFLKNHVIATPGTLNWSQANEKGPMEPVITNFANRARGGAAIVTCKGRSMAPNFDNPHRCAYDPFDGAAQHYFAQLADAVRINGAKPVHAIPTPYDLVQGYDVSEGVPSSYVPGDGSVPRYGKSAPIDLLHRVSDAYAEEAKIFKDLGYEGCYIHMAYNHMFPGRFFSPRSNKRTDEYGGSVENRVRFPLEICEKIKAVCGSEFFIEVSCTGHEPNYDPGITIEDTIKFAMLAQGKIDILQIRGEDIDPSQATIFNPNEVPEYEVAKKITQALRANNCRTKINLVGGFHHPETMERALVDGACDFVGTTRGFITNPDFVVKAIEGRSDDYVPCLRCNKCHQTKLGDWLSCCTVNPIFGLEHKIDRMITAPTEKKKIAVIGGGPAGMEAAIVSADRGYDVTLYEKSDQLGGQLKAGGIPYLKWTVPLFLNYLRHQVEKRKIDVKLNTEVTPGMLKSFGYDVAFIAIGGSPQRPLIAGVDNPAIMTAVDALLNEGKVSGDVVIVGGGEVGVETGMHFAKKGHKIMCLEMCDELAAHAPPIHYRSLFAEAWEKEPNFSYELKARCTGIVDAKTVLYINEAGEEKSVTADTVILATGMRSNAEEAISLYGQAQNTFTIGDCRKIGSIQTALRSAFIQASNV